MGSPPAHANRTQAISTRAAMAAVLLAALSAASGDGVRLQRIEATEGLQRFLLEFSQQPHEESDLDLRSLVEIDLDCPPILPADLSEFAARGFVRQGRWS